MLPALFSRKKRSTKKMPKSSRAPVAACPPQTPPRRRAHRADNSVREPPSKLNSGGTIKWVGQAFHEDGTTVIGQGEGTWETPPDRHIAKTSLLINISDGTTIRSEGEMGLADLEWNGTMYST